jgi:hypothetical protein
MHECWVVARHESLNEARDGAFKLIDSLCLAEQALQVFVSSGLQKCEPASIDEHLRHNLL